MWFALSDAKGADQWRKAAEAKLSRYEREKSQKLIQEWRAAHPAASS